MDQQQDLTEILETWALCTGQRDLVDLINGSKSLSDYVSEAETRTWALKLKASEELDQVLSGKLGVAKELIPAVQERSERLIQNCDRILNDINSWKNKKKEKHLVEQQKETQRSQ